MAASAPIVPLPQSLRELLPRPDHVGPGDCLDCGASATVYSQGERVVVVHAGNMCGGFKTRFTPSEKNPTPSYGIDEGGNPAAPRPESRRALGKGPEGKGEPTGK